MNRQTKQHQKMTVTSWQKIMTSLSFFWFMANLEQSGSRISGRIVCKIYLFINSMCVYLRTKFKVSTIILTSFRQGVILHSPPPQYELLKSPPRLGLRISSVNVNKSVVFLQSLRENSWVIRYVDISVISDISDPRLLFFKFC